MWRRKGELSTMRHSVEGGGGCMVAELERTALLNYEWLRRNIIFAEWKRCAGITRLIEAT
jgi:hypothetical protein